jgi:hypothetical protein
MNNCRVGSFDVLDSQAVEGMPTATLDALESDIISCATVGRRVHSPEAYRQRVSSLQQRIRALPPLVQELIRARFTMEVSR